ncbi:hypothetical protein C0J52_02457 [Blattella germanica]|nr:hypothetical protein C0J52_02457 [Blattella germanica]
MPVTKRTVLLNEPSISLASDVADTGMKNDKSSKENAKDKEKESEDFTRISTVAMIHHYPTSTDERNDESGAVKHEFQSSISSIFPSSSGVQKDLIVSYQPRTLRNTASSKFVKNKKGLSKFHTSTPLPGHIKRAFLCPPKEIDFEEISVYREPCKNKKCKSRPENECRVPRGRNKTKKSVKSTAINSSHTPKPTRSNPNLPKDVKCLENPTGMLFFYQMNREHGESNYLQLL